MTVLLVDAVWLDGSQPCSVDDMARLSGLTRAEVLELASAGRLPMASARDQRNEREGPAGAVQFQIASVTLARSVRRLRDDFELDADALCVAAGLLRRISDLEQQLDELQARYPQSVRDAG